MTHRPNHSTGGKVMIALPNSFLEGTFLIGDHPNGAVPRKSSIERLISPADHRAKGEDQVSGLPNEAKSRRHFPDRGLHFTLRSVVTLSILVLLSGCASSNRPASVAGGECKVFSPAPHVILGKTQTDQDFIDGEIEAGVAACEFPRPGPRPAALDAPVTRQVPAAAPPSAKRPGIFKRLKKRLSPKVANAIAAETPAAAMRPQPPVVQIPPVLTPAPAVTPEPPRAVLPPPPQDPVDALLHPRK